MNELGNVSLLRALGSAMPATGLLHRLIRSRGPAMPAPEVWNDTEGSAIAMGMHEPRANPSDPFAHARAFHDLFDNAPTPLMLVDQHGCITFANPLAAQIFDSSRQALEGSLLEFFVPEGLLDGGTEMVGRRSDGSAVPVSISRSPIQLGDESYDLVAVADLTSLKASAFEAAQQRDQLAHLSRVTMIGELSGALAHELNQPLMAILSNAQAAQRILMQEPLDTNELKEILADIVDDDRRAGDVIRRMRALLTKSHLDHAPVEVNALIVEVLRLVRSDLIHRNVEARLTLASDLPVINGDPVQLQQVLVNLVFNACDAMQGTDDKRIVHVATASCGTAVRISVEDAGSGIPASMLEHMFEPFQTTKAHGMGLGLAVCRTIVTAHGGRIWAENLERGARVCVELGQPGSAT